MLLALAATATPAANPSKRVLYQAVAEHWPAFRVQLEELGGLPKFVVEEDGRLSHLRHSGARLFAAYLPGLWPLAARGVFLQTSRLLPLLRRPSNGGHCRAPRRMRDPGRAHPALDLFPTLGRASSARLRQEAVRGGSECVDADAHPLEQQEPGLSACYAAAAQGVAVSGERAGQPSLRLVVALHRDFT
ncbi:MAG: hypothetical protein SFV15_26590 [Polyangiaceae bacterium]|nr:hypothetical protein [Polyangiaceae bacterium]